jgi:hypothetical protein
MVAEKSWFRVYYEILEDDKIQSLSEPDQRRFLMLLCLRGKGRKKPADDEVANTLRIELADWLKTKANLVERGVIDGSNYLINWDKRQDEPLFSWILEDGEKPKKKNGDGVGDDYLLEIIGLFNEIMPKQIQKPRKLTEIVKRHLRARCAEEKERKDLGWWRQYFEGIAKSDFLMGLSEVPFKVNLLWVVGPINMEKILSGLYENKQGRHARTLKTAQVVSEWLNRD